MKRGLLLFLLLVLPFVFAESDILEAKKSQLDAQSYIFNQKMNYAIDFIKAKGISTENLNKIQSDFQTDVNNAMNAKDNNEFNKAYQAARNDSNRFRKETSTIMKEKSYELKAYIDTKEIKDETLSQKINVSKELRKKLIISAFDTKIEKLKSRIVNENKSKTEILLLEAFQKKRDEADKIKFKLAGKNIFDNTNELLDGVADGLGVLNNFLVKSYNHITEKKNE